MDRGGWQATVHGVPASDMTERLSTSHMLDMLLNDHSGSFSFPSSFIEVQLTYSTV